MSVRVAIARSSAISSGSSRVPKRSPTIAELSVDLLVDGESADVPALGAAGPVDDVSAEARSRCPADRTDVEPARMSLYAPRCAAFRDRS
jgi:hypothetical protein